MRRTKAPDAYTEGDLRKFALGLDVRAIQSIGRIPTVADRFKPHRQRIDQQEPPDKTFAETDDLADDLKRRQSPKQPANAPITPPRHRAARAPAAAAPGKDSDRSDWAYRKQSRSNGRNVVSEPSKAPIAAVTSGRPA